jgi:AAA+ ATPase superfamily predicted ATPase
MVYKIVGREEEQKALERCYTSNSAEFLAVYGRRRVGKTFLIRSFFSSKNNRIFLNVTGMQSGSLLEQIQNFTESVAEAFFHKGVKLEVEKNWHNAFRMLTDNIAAIPKKKKIIIFFDEFPWMATQNSKLLQNLEYFWNQYWSRDARIKLIICGSASGWILKNIINNKKGLYNRVTKTIHLEPFTLGETKKFLISRGIKLNNNQITELYMVLGGIPHYLAQVEKGLSATQAIEQLAFSRNSFLFREFDNLYAAVFNNSENAIEIVRIMAERKYGIGQEELFRSVPHLSSGGRIISLLRDLEDIGFITSFKPKWHKKKGIYYKVADEYTLFYFYWIEPIKKDLISKGIRAGYWEKIKDSASWKSWMGYAFEAICYKHLTQISKALNLSPTSLPATWQYVPKKGSVEQGAQIDLLFDRDDDSITVCEIKCSKNPFVIDKQYAKEMMNKVEVFKTRTKTTKQIFISMISANGIKPTMYSEELVSSCATLNDLFA